MLEACGAEVLRLVRVAIGPVELGQLEKGTARELTAKEKEQLDRALNVSAIKQLRPRYSKYE
jgi:23S rRNA pseudouridine2605 synthase